MYAGDFILQRKLCQVSEAPALSGALAFPRALSHPPCTPGPPPRTLITQHSLHCLQALHSIPTYLKLVSYHTRMLFGTRSLLSANSGNDCLQASLSWVGLHRFESAQSIIYKGHTGDRQLCFNPCRQTLATALSCLCADARLYRSL